MLCVVHLPASRPVSANAGLPENSIFRKAQTRLFAIFAKATRICFEDKRQALKRLPFPV